MRTNNLIHKLIYTARDIRSREMFQVLEKFTRGSVLDVGGGNFYQTAKQKGINFNSWITLENNISQLSNTNDHRVVSVLGDGSQMPFSKNNFDTVLNIQVLEHVIEPLVMIEEMAFVLRENGYMILLIPQTSVIHMVPYHYYNFTRFWIEEAMKGAGLQIVKMEPLGGVWSSMASHLVYFFLQSFRFPGFSTPDIKRNALFYLLFPLMALFALIAIPICMILSLGDLAEEPNNYLVVAIKLPNNSKDPL